MPPLASSLEPLKSCFAVRIQRPIWVLRISDDEKRSPSVGLIEGFCICLFPWSADLRFFQLFFSLSQRIVRQQCVRNPLRDRTVPLSPIFEGAIGSVKDLEDPGSFRPVRI